jgi:predicted NBD/HSP70 family sugar kinase
MVVVAGEITRASDILIKKVVETVNHFALKNIAENTAIRVSALDNNAASLGAVSLILKDFFKVKSL